MKYLLLIIMLATCEVATASALNGEHAASYPLDPVAPGNAGRFHHEFGSITEEQLFIAQVDAVPGVATFSYADVLDEPMRAVVRVESLAGSATDDTEPLSIGSGVIVNADDGFIITNSHVVTNGERLRIRMADGRWRDARLVGMDAVTDLAVLKTETRNLGQVEVADSPVLRVGDVVFAVGYPLGLDQTVSIGIISGLSRSSGGSQLTDYIQTDAAINSGNSGGALLDANGRLIGINTAILSNSGGNMGIGFAIPAPMAIAIAEQLIDFGEVRRGHAGLVLAMVDENASATAGTSNWDGALVAAVEPGSPADLAGLKPGDVILSFNGHHILTPQSLRTWIGVTRAGGTIELEVWRSGLPMSFAMRLAALDKPTASSLSELGVKVRTISPGDGMPEGLEGVLIESIRKNSPAEHAGLLPGDIILSINNELVSNPQVCDRLVHEAAGRAGVVVYRAGSVRRIIIVGTAS